uniref:Flavin-containing monooxygenase n=1 Tax=Phallusia mammillata TaxID=59560 RepID=A0A6F9DDJ4_9ASCI|nr:dimethylaniline monooxygenase [N-oxide-forming] 5-like [Phallusia mammillata]
MKSPKRICIIGGGASGLTATKCCLDECLIPVCYERSGDIGGLWRYTEEKTVGACVYKSTIINTSKEMMCFSDFPIPEHFPNFMHNTKIVEYFRMYANKFGLDKHIQFKTEVVSCEFAKDYHETGRWIVRSKNIETKEEVVNLFDGIIVAVGHHAVPYLPLSSFAGFELFGGGHMHSHDYRNFNGFENKRVLVVGIGNSGGDISVELSRVAKQVFLSTRRGAWVMNRVDDYGLPLDIVRINRFNQFLLNKLPSAVTNFYGQTVLNKKFDHETYGLRPKHAVLSQHPMINDDLPNRVLSGTLTVKGNVSSFAKNGVYFEDNTFEQIDYVIFATGYNFAYPFLDNQILKVKNNETDLYKYIWPPQLERSTLAVVGAIQPGGAVNPISELQCRWITRLFKGLSELPSKPTMNFYIQRQKDDMKKRYYATQRHTVQVDYVKYMDELAAEIGVKPNLLRLAIMDPVLAYKVFFHACTPYQYRLSGPGKWKQARENIMTQHERVKLPLKTRPSVHKTGLSHFLSFFLVAVIAIFIYLTI